MTDNALTFIPINDKLKALGVIRFAKKSNVIDIGFKGGQTVVFDIDPKKVTNTRDNFEKEAKRYPGLSKSTISKVSLVLLDSTNNYLQYLLYSKAAAKAPDGKGDQQHSHITTLSRNPAAVVAMRLAKKHCQDLFIDNLGQPHAAVKIDKHLEVLPIKSSRFKNWLCKIFYDCYTERNKQVHNKDDQRSKKLHSAEDVENEGKKVEGEDQEEDEDTADILTTENLNNVLRVIEARATFSGNPPRELHLRVAMYDDSNSILYDLTNPEWQVVRIAVTGWDIEYAPVVFTRYSNQIPQVYPSKEYPPEIFDLFIGLINIKNDEDNILLLKVYIIALFYPCNQHPALMLHGEKGTAKSTLMELIKMLVDPSAIQTLAFSRNIESMIQKLAHNYICYFDNVSKINESISDILCRAVTGSGFSKRELFTNDDDVIYNFKRCIGINGINLGATKSDLIDRGIIIEHVPIPKHRKRLLKEIWQKFYEIRSWLLGYIFDILVQVLQFQRDNPGGLKLEEYPRLADFAEIGEIISRCMGNRPGKFIEAYFRNIELQTRDVVENDVVGKAIEIFMDSRMTPLWNGTITELLDLLTKIAQDNLKIKTSNGKLWPQAPNSLSRRINLIKADLRSIGILVEKDSLDKSNRQWTIRKLADINRNGNGIIITGRNNMLYQQQIIRKQNYPKVEHISPEQPYRLNPENRAQITRDNQGDISGDISFEPNHIPPCISPEQNSENRAQNDCFRRSDDTGDICSLSSSLQIPKVKKVLDRYLAFDFEWDIKTHVIEAASFVDSTGNSKVLLRSDFDNCSEKELLKYINSKILEYNWSIGWNSTGHANNTEGVRNSDLTILHERCIANDIQSIVSLSPNGVPYIGYPKHIDLCNVYGKVMVQDTIYKKAYRTHKLSDVSKALLGYGKYKDFSGKDFNSLPIEGQIEYSLRDSQLVMELSKYNDFEVLDAMYAISEITGLDFELVCKTNLSKWWSAIFDKMVKDRECQPRTATSFSSTYYEGAAVLTPKQGLYHNVVVVDAISLYPSVAINCNISFDTVNCTCCKGDPSAGITLDSEFLKDCKFIMQDNNCWICKQKEGAFPKKLKVFKEERLKQKKVGNNSKQLALKILINGAYGCFGFAGYAYYDPRVAELITAYGRQTLSKMQDAARNLGFEIIYGDTDSLFLHNAPKESLSKFQDLCSRDLDIELEIKSTYSNFILSSGKKHYLGYGADDKGKEVLDIVGFEGNKNDRPEFVNNVFRQLVNDIIKDGIDPIPNLRRSMSDLEQVPCKINPDLLKISKILGENPEDYKSQTCQAAKIGKAFGARKGDLIRYFDSDVKKTGKSWSLDAADIDTAKYKQMLWNTVREILQIAGYPVHDLSKEFGVKNPKNNKNKNKSEKTSSDEDGHGNA
ncbi:MAG TPA: DNA polymerase domain-containing protein [Nitrososphaeraceae archaeon]|nr:DNA polymerase domain-containing protein [Nitrososphaeraceae archaeon]